MNIFCFQVLGNQILDQIEERASANAWPSVLMVSTSIKRLSLTSGPSQSAIITTTPGQLAKHMITNASFRTKKISDDIPKVLTDDESAVSGSNASRMKSIVEENAAEDGSPSSDLTSPPSSGKPSGGKVSNNNGDGGGKVHTSNKEKLMSKLPNLKVSMTSKKERTHSETIDRGGEVSSDKDETKRTAKGEKNASEKLTKSEKKKSGKLHVTSLAAPSSNLSGSGGGSPSPTSLNSGIAFGRSQNGDGLSVNSKNIESLEQVEELIKMKNLPQETISIHSPESGTTLF